MILEVKETSDEDTKKLIVIFARFITGKFELLRYFTKDSLDNIAKQTILERMVENTVEDIAIFNEMRMLSGEHMDKPLTDVELERLKMAILKKLTSD